MVNNKVKIFGKKQKKRLNQILLFASVLCIYPSIFLSTLSSCSKIPIINNDLLSLNPLGKLINDLDYKDAILGALKDKEYYAKFKYALANEIILKWYEDRAAGGNVIFATNLKQWKQEIDDEYNELVQKKKDVYGSQYQFYLQNEVLSDNGGTEKSYKHKKLVEKVRNDFIDNVWKKDYFTISEKNDGQSKFPNIFCDIKSNFDPSLLNDPSCWSNIGFYAKSNSFFMPDNADSKYLASNLDGDYATIQQYVFDRWYATEKPFFVVEANFDYSAPPKAMNNGYSGLSTIYNFSELNDNAGPNEIFPCFANNDGKAFQHYQDFFKKFNRSLLSLYSNPSENAGKIIEKDKIDKNDNENSIEIPENKFYIPKNLSNGTININNFNENDASNNSLKLVLGSKLSSHTTANIMVYGSLYNDLIFANDNDEPACLNFLSWEKFSGDDELYPLSKLNENKDEKIIVFPMMKLFMLSQRKLNKFNDGTDKSKINSYLDLANVYDLISKPKNIEKITILLNKIIVILKSNDLQKFDTLLKETNSDELGKIIVAIKETLNDENKDKIVSFLNEVINAIITNDDKVFDALSEKLENKEFEKIFSAIKNAKTILKSLINDSWYDLITRDFQKNYLANYEGKSFNNVNISWSDSADDETYNLDCDDLVRFTINTVKIDLPFCPKQPIPDEIDRNEEITDEDKNELKYNNFKKNHQPWLFSLNNKGLNITSIDGHEYIVNNSLKDVNNASIGGKLKSLKNVFKYRLMQQKLDCLPLAIKFDVLGKNGQLSNYFTKNFDNIILELAAQTYLPDLNIKNCDENMNIFKSYKFLKEGSYQISDAFLTQIVQQQNLGSPSELVAYLIKTIKYEIYDDDLKKYLNANDKIYKSCDQKIEYAKFIKANVKQKNNYKKKLGMVTPISYQYFDKSDENDLNSRYVYANILRIICTISDSFFWGNMYSNDHGKYQDLRSYVEINYKTLLDLKKELDSSKYFDDIKLIKPNLTASGFSPQIEQASKAKSNSFWFSSFVVDYTIHDLLSQQSNNYLINQLNLDMFNKYITKVLGNDYESDVKWKALTNDFAKSSQPTSMAMLSAYCVKKILAESNSYNKLCTPLNDFFTNIFNVFKSYYQQEGLSSSKNSSIKYEISQLYATIAYLIANDYANFYKILQKKFTDDERLFIGYFSKFHHNQKELDRHCFIEDIESFDLFALRGKSTNEQENEKRWQSALKKGVDERIKDDKYWSIINKNNKFFSGFNGLISANANIFSLYPELKEAIFSKKNSFANKDHPFNKGIWYEYAGEHDNDGKKIDINFDFGSYGKINLVGREYLARIFKKISTFSLTSDLKKFINNLNQSYNGLESLSFENKWQLSEAKYKICSQLENDKYKICFERLVDASVHKPISSLIDITNKSYYFMNKNDRSNYACLLATQINKNDLYSHNLTPIYNMDEGKWVKGKAGVSPDEFFYLVVDLAMDESVQKQAHRDMRKKVFGHEKIKVFDGKLYNILGSKWIKNWHKKVVGK